VKANINERRRQKVSAGPTGTSATWQGRVIRNAPFRIFAPLKPCKYVNKTAAAGSKLIKGELYKLRKRHALATCRP